MEDRMRKVLVGFGLAATAALALGACGGDDNKAAEDLVKSVTGGSVDVNVDENGNGTISVGGEGGGSISMGGTELPEELKDFPLPEGAKVITTYSGNSESGGGSVVGIGANGKYDEVAADIQSGLEDAGFTISGNYTTESGGVGNSSFSFEGDGMTGTVTVTNDSSAAEGFELNIAIITSLDTSTETTTG